VSEVAGGELEGVEQELTRLRGHERGTSVRATTLNLLVLAPTDLEVNRTSDALTLLGGSRPLRGLILVPADGPARASVSSSCWRNSTGQEVCSEQVVIEAAPAALPSAAVGLLVPDLPVFLLWQGEIERSRRLLEELSELSTRLIADSSECGLEQLRSVAGLTPSVTDLAWTRLLPWREALAMQGDTPDGLHVLEHAIGLEVRGPANEAGLLAGWLRSRLGRQIGLERTGRPKRLERVRVLSPHGELVIERTGSGQMGRAIGPDGSEHAVVLPRREHAWLLGTELDRFGSDPAFEDALTGA
jgi:hypothetical protein